MAGGKDPVLRLAQLRMIRASADLETQLSNKQGGAPALYVLQCLKEKAAQALAALAFVDALDWKAITKLQNEVKRYDEWITDLAQLIGEGKQIVRQMTEADRDEMLDVLLSTPEGQEEAIALGLVDDLRGATDT